MHFINWARDSREPLQMLRLDPQEDNGMHVHDFHELVIVFAGEARHRTETESYRISAGDVFLIRPGESHAYTDTRELEIVNLLYLQDELKMPLYDLATTPGYHAFFELEPEMRRREGYRKHLQVGKKNLDFLDLACRELEKLIHSGEPGRVFSSVAVFMRIVGCIAGSCSPGGGPDGGEHALLWEQSRLVSDLQRQWNRPFNLEELARRHGMSTSTLYRRFVRTFGQSPLDFLLDLRIANARGLLRATGDPIGEIAAATGFTDGNYFSRCFKQRTGQTPGEYRKRNKNN